jgi:glycosyltransferase involved in cell wall biosynthesis
MSDAPVVSVVTPVYNGAEYLEECIQSVLRQTYTHWEYIIVDNMSTDDTFVIAQRFASRDPRIRLERATEFVGIHANSNRALRAIHPRSRYCKTVHADDWLYPNCLEEMLAVAEAHPSVGIVSAFALVGTQVWLDGVLPYDRCVIPGAELIRREMLHQEWLLVSPTSFLVRADLVRAAQDFYDETIWHADTDAAYRVLSSSDFGFVHQVLSYSRVQPGATNEFSNRVWSFIARDGVLLIRHGPTVLSRNEYTRAVRRWLVRYGLWLVKQNLKPSRARQQEFHEFHRREIDCMIAQPNAAPEVKLALAVFRKLLRTRHGAGGKRRSHPRGN